MKKSLLLIICAVLSNVTHAEKVTEQEALQKAQQFLQGKKIELVDGGSRRLRRVHKTNVTSDAYYVFNVEDNGGFVIVSGDDRTEEILAFAEEGYFNTTNMPSNVKAWLGYYEHVINSLGNQQISSASKRNIRADITPLVKTTWGQNAPYNQVCSQYGPQIVTGCVATAMAQVINYNQWPVNTSAPIPSYISTPREIEIAEQPITSFNWGNMDDAEIARLMMYCGASVQMHYGYYESGASDMSIAHALKKYFGYDDNTRYVLRSNYDIDEWEDLIYLELSEKRAVIYGGISTGAGHQFVCDGYKDGLFHINWGWDGDYNAYYSLSILNPNGFGTGGSSSNDGYSMSQSAVIGIQKPTGLSPEGKETLTQRPLSCNADNQIEFILMNSQSDTFVGEIGIGLYQNDILQQILCKGSVEIPVGIGMVFNLETSMLSGISEGTYQVRTVCREKGEVDWLLCNNAMKHYVEVRVSDGAPTLVVHPQIDLTVNSLTFTEGRRPSILQDIVASVTNNSKDELNSSLAMFVNGEMVSATGAFIRSGETSDVIFRYSPIMGNLDVKIQEERGQFIYEEVIPVFNEGDEDDPFFNLAENQQIFGHYTTHDYDANGPGFIYVKWITDDDGISRPGYCNAAVKFSDSKMATIKGRKITHLRFALRTTTGVDRVKVWAGSSLDNWDVMVQDVPNVHEGWNTIALSVPIEVDGSELCMGIQLYQEPPCYPGAFTSMPFSSTGSYLIKPEGAHVWENLEHVSPGGSLSLQCLVQGDIKDYDVELIRKDYPTSYSTEVGTTKTTKYVKKGTVISDGVNFMITNIGRNSISSYTIGWQIDNGEIHNDEMIRYLNATSDEGYVSFILPSSLTVGSHTVFVYVTSINGIAYASSKDRAIKTEYKVWSQQVDRQKHLIDFQAASQHFGTDVDAKQLYNLMGQRDDVTLLTTFYRDLEMEDAVFQLFRPRGMSWIVYNRDARPGQAYFLVHNTDGDMSEELKSVARNPAFVTVNINASVNNQKELEIKVSGTRNDEFEQLFNNPLLTVALTADSVCTKQVLENGESVDNYIHNGVLRRLLTDTWGDNVIWNGNSYEMIYTVKPSVEWDLQKMKIVAFLSEKAFNYTNACDVDVLQCNDFSLSNIDCSEIERVETRLKYNIINDGEVEVRMRDKTISGDLSIPSHVIIGDKSYRVSRIGIDAFWNSNIRNVVLPNTITTIGSGAFRMSSIEYIYIPASVSSIEYNFVQECQRLKSITVELGNKYYAVENDALISIHDSIYGKTLFAYPVSNGIKEYAVPSGVVTIYGAFNYLGTLEKVILPEGLKNLYGSFSYCYNLKEINTPPTIVYESGWNYAYTSLEEYVAPSSLESMGSGNFFECRHLKTVSLKDSKITWIGNDLFYNCIALEEVSLPATVAIIDVSMFRSCSALRRFYVYNSEPADLFTISSIEDRPSNEFEDIVYANATLYVPRGSIEAYRNSPGWNKFTKIEEFDAPVNVVARNFERIYGEANPTFEYTVEGGLLEGKPEIICEATETSPVGEYPIVVKQGTIKNQNVSYIAGTLTVVKAPLTTIANSYMKRQYEPMPEFSVFYIGFKNNETKDVLTKQPVLSCEANEDSTPGEYTITVSGAEAENYEIQYIAGKLTVTEASYTLTYIVDGKVYQSISVKYRDSITPLEAPEKEGYTFSGWSEIPEIMPNHDVTVTGSFTANSYTLTYIVDGEEYKSFTIKYRDPITPLEAPTKEGYTFYGWDGLPRSMPAQNVTVTGYFTINTYTVMYVLDGEVYTTETLKYGAKIVPPVILGLEDYTIWEDVPETMPAFDITIYGKAKEIIDSLTPALSKSEGKVYDLSGRKINYQLSTFNSQFRKKGIYIIRMKDGTTRKELIK